MLGHHSKEETEKERLWTKVAYQRRMGSIAEARHMMASNQDLRWPTRSKHTWTGTNLADFIAWRWSLRMRFVAHSRLVCARAYQRDMRMRMHCITLQTTSACAANNRFIFCIAMIDSQRTPVHMLTTSLRSGSTRSQLQITASAD